MKYGFIGFGEAAYQICSGLKEHGVATDIVAFDVMQDSRPLVRERAQEVGVELLPSSALLSHRRNVPNYSNESGHVHVEQRGGCSE